VQDLTASGNAESHRGVPRDDQVLDQVGLAVIATDADGVVTTWNVRAEELLGWTRREAVGRRARDLALPASLHPAADEVRATLRRAESWQGAFRLRSKDGAAVRAFLRCSPVQDDAQRVVGMVAVAIEIGDAKLAEAVREPASDGQVRHPSARRSRALSPRERQVLALLARGLTGEQIAERLVLSPETVRTHIRNAREKLGASTRVEAVTMALLGREIEL
jgi:PAS domain S-box-containing protein